jgi:hypothetical protein
VSLLFRHTSSATTAPILQCVTPYRWTSQKVFSEWSFYPVWELKASDGRTQPDRAALSPPMYVANVFRGFSKHTAKRCTVISLKVCSVRSLIFITNTTRRKQFVSCAFRKVGCITCRHFVVHSSRAGTDPGSTTIFHHSTKWGSRKHNEKSSLSKSRAFDYHNFLTIFVSACQR